MGAGVKYQLNVEPETHSIASNIGVPHMADGVGVLVGVTVGVGVGVFVGVAVTVGVGVGLGVIHSTKILQTVPPVSS